MKNESHEPESGTEAHSLVAGEADFAQYAPDAFSRRDGWTPFCRRLFLSVLAETGRVTLACTYCGLTRQSANALRHRDPLFAAGWDAACTLARGPLADDVSEQARDGVTDTLRRNGEILAERHRFDTRLSMAVLHRLDKRCDRAEEIGSPFLGLVRNWDEFLTLLGQGEDQAALALTENVQPGTMQPETAHQRKLRQLPLCANPTRSHGKDASRSLARYTFDRFWWDDERGWMIDFPPPADFAGYELRPFAQDRESAYKRTCTKAESALLDADAEEVSDADIADDAALRDTCLEEIRRLLAARGPSPRALPVPVPVPRRAAKKAAAAQPKPDGRSSPLKQ